LFGKKISTYASRKIKEISIRRAKVQKVKTNARKKALQHARYSLGFDYNSKPHPKARVETLSRDFIRGEKLRLKTWGKNVLVGPTWETLPARERAKAMKQMLKLRKKDNKKLRAEHKKKLE